VTEAGFPFRNLGALVRPGADPDKAALVDLSRGAPRTVSFAELDALADAAARGLLRRGLGRGDRVGLLAANSAGFLAAFYGAQRAGLVPVPVNWRFPAATVEYVLRDSGARLVLHDAARAAAVPGGLPAAALDGPGWDALLDPGPFEAIEPAPAEPAFFLYTSGSTGRPKGVVLSHQSHLWVVEQRLAGGAIEQETALVAAPLYHMNGLALAQLACAGHATVVLLPQFEARAYLAAVAAHRCTWITGVPPMYAMLLREREALAATDVSSVRNLRMGSAPVSPALLAEIAAAFPRARIVNGYGTTEAGPVVFGPHPRGLPTPPLSVGYPHPAVELRLRGDDGAVGGDQGVLEQRCPGLMNGYWNRPELPPPVTEDGFYVTGDVFRRDADGFHFFVGRADDMFVSGGENIFPGEVEKLLETHPAVEQSAVIAVDDAIKGQKPVAFVVLRPGAAADEAALKAHVLANAPAFMHPRRVWFLRRLPLSGTNKVDKAALAALARDGAGAT
jgi:acyl-CoA synthetase (AMP-forming)/AMP-acid ligase II